MSSPASSTRTSRAISFALASRAEPWLSPAALRNSGRIPSFSLHSQPPRITQPATTGIATSHCTGLETGPTTPARIITKKTERKSPATTAAPR